VSYESWAIQKYYGQNIRIKIMMNTVYLYLLSPLHTGGTTQEGNLLGIARESHTNFPYIPSSTIRGKLRSSVTDRIQKAQIFGADLDDLKNEDFVREYEIETGKKLTQLEQGQIWIGDGSMLWIPVPSLSHGVVWVSCPMLLERWQRIGGTNFTIPDEYSTNLGIDKPIYLKDAILKDNLKKWEEYQDFTIKGSSIKRVLVLPDRHCDTLIQMSLWRQVKIKLDENKVVNGGFRYEEAIPPDALMYFPWGVTAQAKANQDLATTRFKALLDRSEILQIGGQESLGRGFVQHWI
jgi:CRISPR-associated protein Cmr4